MLKICVAGATGWTGDAIARAVVAAEDMELAACVARASGGQMVHGAPCFATLDQALSVPFDVLIDYTSPEAVMGHTLSALAAGRCVVVGSSGLTAADYERIDQVARKARLGVVASGNFALTAALMTRFSLMATAYLEWFEVLDYAAPGKIDAPTGTARELAERMAANPGCVVAR